MNLLLAHAHFEDLGALEWVVVGVAALIGAWTIWLAVKYTIAPGEENRDHVKFSILDDPAAIHVTAAPSGPREGNLPPPQSPPQASGLGARPRR